MSLYEKKELIKSFIPADRLRVIFDEGKFKVCAEFKEKNGYYVFDDYNTEKEIISEAEYKSKAVKFELVDVYKDCMNPEEFSIDRWPDEEYRLKLANTDKPLYSCQGRTNRKEVKELAFIAKNKYHVQTFMGSLTNIKKIKNYENCVNREFGRVINNTIKFVKNKDHENENTLSL